MRTADLDRARRRHPELDRLLSRAGAALANPVAPFVARDMSRLIFGWRQSGHPPGTTLFQAVETLHAGSDQIRTLALCFALSGARRYADAAEALMLRWAREHTVVNFYDFEPDFRSGTHRGQTRGFDSERPWNFGLDSMWQSYGLVNVADAVLLLRRGGHVFGPDRDAEIGRWLRRLAEGVNAGFHAWTRWADENHGDVEAEFHATSRVADRLRASTGVERHRSDNHLTWALCGLFAGGVALDDAALQAYALHGGVWNDGRAGPYDNPSPIVAVMERAIELEPHAYGRMFEERIGRQPLIGYALFHLEAMVLAARMAWVQGAADLWREGTDTRRRLLAAHQRYAPFLTGQARSSDASEYDGVVARWIVALAPPSVAGDARRALVEARPLPEHMTHMVGPADLLFGE